MPIPTSNIDAPSVTAVFSSAYLGNVRYYAAMLSNGGMVSIDPHERITRQSWMHNHCRIVGANGVQVLTVPVEHLGTAPILMRDLRIAKHGNWQRVHWGALFSAYGKTPFFEYAEDDLRAIYDRQFDWLIDFNMALHEMVVEFLDLPLCTTFNSIDDNYGIDWRGFIGGKKADTVKEITNIPYYNIWSERHGFIPSLSIIDLMMNCGRESIFILNNMLNTVLI